ncbi:MAG: rhodanese-like domain-containing protein [Clostridia bacterium]|nr:rhodanese-like domain-containing protein [Clostridia bacterium]
MKKLLGVILLCILLSACGNNGTNINEKGNKAGEMLPDEDKQILVYCRSGRRSKIAAESLVELGYTNVKEFRGIIDWHYDIDREA